MLAEKMFTADLKHSKKVFEHAEIMSNYFDETLIVNSFAEFEKTLNEEIFFHVKERTFDESDPHKIRCAWAMTVAHVLSRFDLKGQPNHMGAPSVKIADLYRTQPYLRSVNDNDAFPYMGLLSLVPLDLDRDTSISFIGLGKAVVLNDSVRFLLRDSANDRKVPIRIPLGNAAAITAIDDALKNNHDIIGSTFLYAKTLWESKVGFYFSSTENADDWVDLDEVVLPSERKNPLIKSLMVRNVRMLSLEIQNLMRVYTVVEWNVNTDRNELVGVSVEGAMLPDSMKNGLAVLRRLLRPFGIRLNAKGIKFSNWNRKKLKY